MDGPETRTDNGVILPVGRSASSTVDLTVLVLKPLQVNGSDAVPTSGPGVKPICPSRRPSEAATPSGSMSMCR